MPVCAKVVEAVAEPSRKGSGVGQQEKKGLVHSVEEKKEGTSEVAFIKEKGKQNRGRAVSGKRKARVLSGAITMGVIIYFASARNGRKPKKS